MDKDQINKIIQEEIKKQFQTAFTSRKLGDNPTDSLQLANVRYINLNGTTAQRPTKPPVGQQYFDTTLGKPIFRKNSTTWVDAAGNSV